MNRIPVTLEGEKQLRAELRTLKSKERPSISKRIAEARSHGDLSENAEYHAAREKQGLIEARIRYLDARLSNMQVIDISKHTNDGKVIFGATVRLKPLNDAHDKYIVHYKIVGEDEADIKQHKLSVNSPLARALVGTFEGEEISIDIPNGQISYEILKVTYVDDEK